MKKRKIYLTLHPDTQNPHTIKEMFRIGVDGFILSFRNHSPSSYANVVHILQDLSFQMHKIPDLIVLIDSYQADLLPVFAAYHVTHIWFNQAMHFTELSLIKRDLMEHRLSRIHFMTDIPLDCDFTEIMQLQSFYDSLLIDRSIYDIKKYNLGEAYIKYQELIRELSFGKIHTSVICPIRLEEESSLISEFSDLSYCIKSGAKTIILSYPSVLSLQQIPLLQSYCDVVQQSSRPEQT